MADAMRQALAEKTYRAAVALYGEGNTASSLAAMEKAYLDHLGANGSPDTDTGELFGADRALFWFDVWKRARGRGA